MVSCSKTFTINMQGRVFVDGNQYKSESLEFVNDTICLYTQELHCNVSDQYKKMTITCLYKITNSNIILTNINYHPDSSYNCIKLPEKEVNNCKFLKEESDKIIEKTSGCIGCFEDTPLNDSYSYLDNVGIDTLYYKDNYICYRKWMGCEPSFAPIHYCFVDKNFLKKLVYENIPLNSREIKNLVVNKNFSNRNNK